MQFLLEISVSQCCKTIFNVTIFNQYHHRCRPAATAPNAAVHLITPVVHCNPAWLCIDFAWHRSRITRVIQVRYYSIGYSLENPPPPHPTPAKYELIMIWLAIYNEKALKYTYLFYRRHIYINRSGDLDNPRPYVRAGIRTKAHPALRDRPNHSVRGPTDQITRGSDRTCTRNRMPVGTYSIHFKINIAYFYFLI